MKNLKLFFGVAFLSGALLFTGCGKYEEGPSLSLKTKKGRLSREWVPEKFIDGASGISASATSGSGSVTFKKDGTFSTSMFGFTGSGTWEFVSGKEKLSTKVDGQSTAGIVTILKLTSKEFWTKDEDGDQVHYKAK